MSTAPGAVGDTADWASQGLPHCREMAGERPRVWALESVHGASCRVAHMEASYRSDRAENTARKDCGGQDLKELHHN